MNHPFARRSSNRRTGLFTWLALVLSSSTLATLKAETVTPNETNAAKITKSKYVILYRPGSAWIEDKPLFEQDLQEHGSYMAKLLEEKKLLMAGPFGDNSGGIAVVVATSLSEAEKIITDDPAVKTKVFSAQAHPWHVMFQASPGAEP